jgi:6,7-dimethyl-8-ribityllumazine synthase
VKRILVIASKFNDYITRSLHTGAVETLKEDGFRDGDVDTVWVPGCFELPVVAAKAAKSGSWSAIICLGAVIRGETPHFDYVAGQAAAGIMKASTDSGVPVIFGVLTTDTVEQALNRAGIKYGNKGSEAAKTAVEMIKCMSRVEELARK